MHPHTMHKNKLNMTKDLNIRYDTIKLLEENIGKTFSDINHTNVFLGQSPKAIEIKIINRYSGLKLLLENFEIFSLYMLFLVAQLVKNPPANTGTWVQSLGQEDSLEE